MRTIFLTLFALLVLLSPAHLTADEPTLEQRVLVAMLRLSPPEKHRQIPGFEETPEQALARYQSIAADVAAVATEAAKGNAWQAQLYARDMVGVARHESGLRRDVDLGACYQAPGDHWCDWDGRQQTSEGLWQLKRARHLRGDRRAQARVALSRIRHSRQVCAALPPSEQLAAFAGGVCDLLTVRAAARSLYGDIQKTAAVGL